MEKEKVEGVTNWPMPQCIKDVQKFLGLANYYTSWSGRQEVEVERGAGKCVHEIERDFHNRTSTGGTRSG